MNKKLTIILTSLIAVLSVVSIILINLDENSKTLEITVDTNGGVPYIWEYEIEDEQVVKYIKILKNY